MFTIRMWFLVCFELFIMCVYVRIAWCERKTVKEKRMQTAYLRILEDTKLIEIVYGSQRQMNGAKRNTHTHTEPPLRDV